jgi:hypothetical protein
MFSIEQMRRKKKRENRRAPASSVERKKAPSYLGQVISVDCFILIIEH